MRHILLTACLATIAATAHASPYIPETFEQPGVAQLYSSLNGYARAYGNCYGLLRDMGPLRDTFWASEPGRKLLDGAPMWRYGEVYRTYIELPCHLCEAYESMASYRQPCMDAARELDTLWGEIEGSEAWKTARQSDALQAVFTGWERFTECMQ